jgi:hypothetical protein
MWLIPPSIASIWLAYVTHQEITSHPIFTLSSVDISLIKVSARLPPVQYFRNACARSLFDLSWPNSRGMSELSEQRTTEEHCVIDDAFRNSGEGYTVFSIVSQKHSPKQIPGQRRIYHLVKVTCSTIGT